MGEVGTMSIQEEIHYHQQRAMRELDQGMVAASVPAARAHLQLSSLHMAKVRDLQGPGASANPPLIMG
ncbi:MAG TPA: hypothetical protein VGB54_11595 [Allosphingosinicella sp.]